MEYALNIIIYFILIVILPSLYHMKFNSLNPLIDVGKDIYCQHDENNETIFQIKKSGDIYTKVYKIIIPIFTANKMWLKNGTLIDCSHDLPIGATNKNDYISVKEGEQYFLKIYGLDFNNSVPVLFLDERDNYVQSFFSGIYSKGKKGVEVTVPFGAKKMHFTNYNRQGVMVQKILNMTDKEIDKLCINENIIMEKINNSYMKYVRNPVVYQKIKKAYISFMIDGTSSHDETYINLFIEKGIPLSLATIPERLIDNASSGTKTNLDMVKKLIATGKGEILSFNGEGVLTKEKLGDYNEMYKIFIKPKQIFNIYGIEVNGAIFLSGSGQILFNEEEEKWASSFYGYSDLYGLRPKYREICIDSAYYHQRTGLNFNDDIEKMKAEIDKDINEKNYRVYTFRAQNDDNIGNLSQLLDYVKQKEKEGKLNIGNYKEFYEKNAIFMNDLIKIKHTYYVSSNGNSEDGLSEKTPMNIETLKSKSFISGDKILFKRGDIFYGSLRIKFTIVDDTILTLSSYGDTKKGKPILSCYKIVNKKESWEKESNNIYRIDLTNINKFSGIKDITSDSTRIGFMETKNKTKYYNLKSKLSELNELYDFFSNGTYFFVRTNGATPYEELGELKLAPKIMLLTVSSNMKIENLHIQGTGSHGIVGTGVLNENIEIVNNIIEDIGGSFLYENRTRYGNGIEFWETDVKNLKIHKNIIRSIYDVGFTIQGYKGSGTNITLTKNIFCLNSQDSEIWESGDATGINNYIFEDNISFLQGRGWGYLARSDKYCAGHILFWGYLFDNVEQKTNIYFNHNYIYNPKRIYYIADQLNTSILFKEKECIRSDYNHYYLNNDSFIYRDKYDFNRKSDFILDFNKDKNSEFILLDKVDPILVDKSENSLDYNELRKIFVDDVDNKDEKKSNSHVTLIIIVVIIIIILTLVGGIFVFKKIKNKNDESSIDKLIDFPSSLKSI